jgi:hypothetical protein
MTLTEKRAADRAKMADKLQAVAEAAGATVTRPEPFKERQILLRIAVPGGAYVTVEFDGESCQPDVHVITWNTEHDCLFAFAACMGSVNEFHFSKATRVCYGLDPLCEQIAYDIEHLRSGRFYSAKRAAKLAADRRDRFEKGREYLATLVAAGKGTTWADGTECESPEQVRADFQALPDKIAQLNGFIAAGAPMSLCAGFPWR